MLDPVENIWRHWWAGHMAAVGGTSRLRLEPLSEDIKNVLNGDSPLDAPVAEIIVAMSDGSAFAGSLGFGAPDYNVSACFGIQGSQVVVACQLPEGERHHEHHRHRDAVTALWPDNLSIEASQ
jgi:hypothetical protein